MTKQVNRRQFIFGCAGIAAASGLAPIGGWLYGTQVEPDWPELVQARIPIPGLEPALRGLRIAQLSDIHLRRNGSTHYIREAVEMVNRLEPDLIVLTGDYTYQSSSAASVLAPLLTDLNPRLGTFASLGNHDHWNKPKNIRKRLEEAGITVLVNAGQVVEYQDTPIYIAGVDDILSGAPDWEKTFGGRPEGAFTVLLAHEPDVAPDVARRGDVHLQLSGHTHGGQVRLPLLGAVVLPQLGKEFEMGYYAVNGMALYVNRGLGVIDPPVRVNCRPEITEITLDGG